MPFGSSCRLHHSCIGRPRHPQQSGYRTRPYSVRQGLAPRPARVEPLPAAEHGEARLVVLIRPDHPAWSTLSQRLTGNAIAVAIEAGVAIPQKLLGPGVAADLLALVAVDRPRGRPTSRGRSRPDGGAWAVPNRIGSRVSARALMGSIGPDMGGAVESRAQHVLQSSFAPHTS